MCEIEYGEFLSNKEKFDNLSNSQLERAEHFFEENIRVESCDNAINSGDYFTFIKCLNDSGKSSLNKLKNCFVEGEKDPAIPKALNICNSVIKNGACRVHGGGFAGCVLVAIKKRELNRFIRKCSKFYPINKIIPVTVREFGVICL